MLPHLRAKRSVTPPGSANEGTNTRMTPARDPKQGYIEIYRDILGGLFGFWYFYVFLNFPWAPWAQEASKKLPGGRGSVQS